MITNPGPKSVTITEADRETFQSTVKEFQPQINEDQCLPAALKNILDELADRHDGSHTLSLSDLADICDYREGFASSTRNIHSRLNPEIEQFNLEVKTTTGTHFDDLEAIINNDYRSLPIVELDDAYFDSIEGYTPLGGVDGYQWVHTVIPFAVNDEEVLFYDPYGQILRQSSRIDVPPTERSQTEFYEWWTAAGGRWTLWIERRDQQMLTSTRFEK